MTEPDFSQFSPEELMLAARVVREYERKQRFERDRLQRGAPSEYRLSDDPCFRARREMELLSDQLASYFDALAHRKAA